MARCGGGRFLLGGDAMMSDGVTTTAAARDDGARVAVTVCARCYRENEKTRIVAGLLGKSSLLVVSGAGVGKNTLAQVVGDEMCGGGVSVAVGGPRHSRKGLCERGGQ